MKKAVISPKNLKTLRERKGWSQEELAKISKVTSRTILAIEKSDKEQVAAQHKTFAGLAKALGERPGVLSGEEPLPEEGKPYDLHVQLSPQVRLNFDLIKKKYGVDILDIINVAPLLFVSAAEESLQRQQEQVDKEEEEFAKLAKLWYQISNLGETLSYPNLLWIPDDYTPEHYFAERRHAVKIKDLFESNIYDDYAPPAEHSNPFADYLYDVSQKAILRGTVQVEIEDNPYHRYGYSFSACVPDHSVCLDILKQITLGSVDAERALNQGVVSISEIPQDLWEPRKAGERVAWLEDKYLQAPGPENDEFTMSEEELSQSLEI